MAVTATVHSNRAPTEVVSDRKLIWAKQQANGLLSRRPFPPITQGGVYQGYV